MPELPEVETMRRDLQKAVGRKVITAVEVLDPKAVAGGPDSLTTGLAGRHVRSYDRRGKVLILRLDDGRTLLLHPRMTGRFQLLRPHDELPRHARVVFHLSGGQRLVFEDPRRFGRVELRPAGEEEAGTLLCRIGPDATRCDADRLREALRRRRTPIKALLLDQTILAGIGNIYASEICYRCGLDPRTPSHALRLPEVRQLAAATEAVLSEGIALRGTTISDYRTVGGRSGGFQKRLAVYGREGEICLRAGCPGRIQRVVLAGRSTYFCSHCQRKGRRRK
ncbi:MAG: bifunctional DNA-formamidopyrimidine glycosylase/DNA-(apurinic or apyrimidinic site) lyase [Armatimonadetes bacterium]|nr:bifunctional DNA-formamidopyrimidine glycosylase/DNA-(apurinic or apyrimidinic site) lyase [Armatimonadota bacterium]